MMSGIFNQQDTEYDYYSIYLCFLYSLSHSLNSIMSFMIFCSSFKVKFYKIFLLMSKLTIVSEEFLNCHNISLK